MSKKRSMYHTQGFTHARLTEPIRCVREDAWLGAGYYYWKDEEDALYWGQTAKKKYKKFSIYVSDIDCENVLDTVFDEDHYNLWIKSIDKAIKALHKKSSRKPTIEDVNSYFMDRAGWDTKVTGIMFQDLPSNETISKVVGFYYRKRIQLAAFDNKIITNFAHHFDGDC